MYIVANRVPVAAPWREQFEERFRTRAGQIDTQPGFVRLQVLRPADAESPYVILTTWRDQAAFEAWVGSEDFRLAHKHPLPKEAYTGDGRLEQHAVVITAEARGTLSSLALTASQWVMEPEGKTCPIPQGKGP